MSKRKCFLLGVAILSSVAVLPRALAGTSTCFGREATIVGTDRSETLRGTPGKDVIVGKDGQDRIYGFGGNDLICGNGFYLSEEDTHGSDRLFGGRGSDKIDGGLGDDGTSGGRGDDLILAGGGTDGGSGFYAGDSMDGGPGDDEMVGSRFGDTFYPGSGRDIVKGRRSLHGDDALVYGDSAQAVEVDLKMERVTGQGLDHVFDIENVYGSPWSDTIRGTFEENLFEGLDGNDTLVGRGGNDLLLGRAGQDRADGGTGRDQCYTEKRTNCEPLP